MSEPKSPATEHRDSETETDRPPSGNADAALAFLGDDDSLSSVSEEEERRVLRKTDWILLPAMVISLTMQVMDKSCLGAAVLFGIDKDLELFQIDENGQKDMRRLSNATAILYWGYLVGTIPGAMLAQKLPLAKYLSATMFAWGLSTLLTVFVQSYHGLLAQRFFLGFCEASLSPAFSIVTSMWYRRREQPLRLSIWYSSSGLGSFLASVLLYGVGQIKGSLSPWRYQFVVIGSLTCVWSMALYFLLPSNPMTAWFLTPDERTIAVRRIASEQTGIENKTIKPAQIKEALRDPKSWAFILTAFLIMLVNGPLAGFAPVFGQSFGFDKFKLLLVLSATGVIVFTVVTGCGIITAYVPNARINLAIACCMPVIAGCLIIWKSSWEDRGVPLAGIYLLSFFAGTYVMLLSVMTANTAGHTKKSFTAGMVWTSYCVSNGVAPQFVFGQEIASHFRTTWIIMICAVGSAAVLLLVLRAYLAMENRRRDMVAPVNEDEVKALALRDVTDSENRQFRFQM